MAEYIQTLETLYVAKEASEGSAEALAAGDGILAEEISVEIPRQFHERTYTGAMGTLNGKIGAIDAAAASFVTELKADGSNNIPEWDELMESCMGSVTATSATTTVSGSGSSTTSVDVTDASGFTDGGGTAGAGAMVLVETTASSSVFEAAYASDANTASTPDNLTVEPALSFTPADTSTVTQMRTYKLAETGHPSLTIRRLFEKGAGGADTYQVLTGARGTFTINSPSAGAIPKTTWNLQAWDWTQATDGTYVAPTYEGGAPPTALACKCKINGTLVDITSFSLDLGNEVGKKMSQNSSTGVYGTPIVDRKIRGSFTVHPSDLTYFTRWTGNTEFTFIIQFGNTANGTVAIYMPHCETTAPVWGLDGKVRTNEIAFNANIASGNDALYIGVG